MQYFDYIRLNSRIILNLSLAIPIFNVRILLKQLIFPFLIYLILISLHSPIRYFQIGSKYTYSSFDNFVKLIIIFLSKVKDDFILFYFFCFHIINNIFQIFLFHINIFEKFSFLKHFNQFQSFFFWTFFFWLSENRADSLCLFR